MSYVRREAEKSENRLVSMKFPLIKFVVRELNGNYENTPTGSFGRKNFHSFMAEVLARTDEDTGVVDLDRG